MSSSNKFRHKNDMLMCYVLLELNDVRAVKHRVRKRICTSSGKIVDYGSTNKFTRNEVAEFIPKKKNEDYNLELLR